MDKATLKPDSISQKEKRKPTGLQGKHFLAVKRNGKTYKVNTKDQDDPKYFHLWDNLSHLKHGKPIQCGHTNAYNCTTKTEHGIPGYRNICPIGGVTGTYVQPSPIYLTFNPSDYGISNDMTIKKLTLSFKHRCTSANVANNKEYIGEAPNFSGFNKYPENKVITVSFNGDKKVYEKNPPLSLKNYEKVSFTFDYPKGITGKTLKNNKITIAYGHNLEADAGILYLDDLSLSVDYIGKKLFFTGVQNQSTVYTSEESDCKTKMTYTLKAGYKESNKIVAPYNQQSKITYSAPKGVSVKLKPQSDNVTVIAEVTDNSLTPGKKNIYFTLKTNGKKLGFTFETKLRKKPSITIPSVIEKNVVMSTPAIIVNDGCTKNIKVYVDEANGEPSFEFTNLQLNNSNMVKQNDINAFYTFLQTLPCGPQTLYFQRGNESSKTMLKKSIRVISPKYKIEAEYNERIVSNKISGLIQNKNENQELVLRYIQGKKELINNPKFTIINPTYGLIQNGNPTKSRIAENGIQWTPEKTGGEITIPIGTYYPGDYVIQIQQDNSCDANTMDIEVEIKPSHKQSFDSIFIRGEDSTAFDYDYLVALEGDTIQEPVYPISTTLGASYKDISLCVDKENYISRIGGTEIITLQVTNNSGRDITNLHLELNLLKKDDEDNYYVSTDEWVENGGMFSTLKDDFYNYNEDISNIIEIFNLTEDADEIDEEDVYINIKQLKPLQTIPIKIPFNSYMERDSYLQILLFEEPMEISICNNPNKKINIIPLKVFDSILTEMSISGDTDILFADKNCPLECFNTENGIRYTVKNIDTSDVEGDALFTINNDPRLIPYKINYKGNKGTIDGEDITYTPDEIKEIVDVSILNQSSNKNININIKNGETTQFDLKNDLDKTFIEISSLQEIEGLFSIYVLDEENNKDIVFEKNFSNISNTTQDEYKIYSILLEDIEESLDDMIEDGSFNIDIVNTNNELIKNCSCVINEINNKEYDFPVNIINRKVTESQTCRGIKIKCDIDFGDLYPKESIIDYTDANSIVTFFIKIPNEIGGEFTIDSLIDEKICNITNYNKDETISIIKNNYFSYKPGQIIPLKILVTKNVEYIKNQIIFKADIIKSGQMDYIDVYYKICNLENNEGELQTTFKTKTDEGEYNLLPNEVSETILCGVQTDLTPEILLKQIIIEQKHINRLYISLKNKKRFNKDITITILEKNDDEINKINKYKYLSHNNDIGDIIVKKSGNPEKIDNIVWNIPYLAKDSSVTSYIDFEAENIGISNFNITIEDFLSKEDKTKFGVQCECRKPKEDV